MCAAGSGNASKPENVVRAYNGAGGSVTGATLRCETKIRYAIEELGKCAGSGYNSVRRLARSQAGAGNAAGREE